MKDIIISGYRIKKELIILLVCFLASFGLNIYSIAKFETDWSELIGQLHIVILVSLVIYFLVLAFRLVFLGLHKLIKRNK